MIKDFFDKHFEEYPKKVLVAVSGGADSMALTLMLSDFCHENGVVLVAVTVDHGMREGSDVEAIAVGNALLERRVEHKILKVGGSFEVNIEANLRNARYDLIADFAAENGVEHVFTGHHKGDQAENFLIRLFRGSQLDGLSGMDEVVELKGLNLCRPFLSTAKEGLVTYLQDRGVIWFEDESNKDERFLRNKVRGFLDRFEEKDVICDRIVKFSEIVREARDSQDKEVLEAALDMLIFVESGENKGSFLLNLAKYREADCKTVLKMLSLVMMEVSQKGYKPRLEGLGLFERDILALEKGQKRDFYGCQAKLLTKSNAGNVLELLGEQDLEDFLWIYPLQKSGDFRFRTILRGLSFKSEAKSLV